MGRKAKCQENTKKIIKNSVDSLWKVILPNLIKISRDRTLKKLWILKQKMIKNPDILEKFEREKENSGSTTNRGDTI